MQPIINEYLEILNNLNPLSSQTRELLLDCISTRTIPKGELLLKHGEVCEHIYYVDKGLMRIFYYKNNREITEWLASDKQFLFSICSYFEASPSKLIIEALEDSEVILLSKEKQEVLIKTNLEVANLMIKAFSYSLILSQKRMESLQFETAKERYINLMEQQPEIIRKVPMQYIASFLGITKETLSRIRSKI